MVYDRENGEPEDQDKLGVVGLEHLLPVEQAGIITLRGKRSSTPTERFISMMRDTLTPAGVQVG